MADAMIQGMREHFGKPSAKIQFATVTVITVVLEIWLIVDTYAFRWHMINLYFWALCAFTPFVSDPSIFFKGGIPDTSKSNSSSFLLGSSAFISWIFAKSITNSAKKGGSYGITGGFGYAGWYISFPAAALIIYQLRKQGYRSLPEAINDKYGKCATVTFALACIYRLFNEVWSNSRVVADFYGNPNTDSWWTAAVLSTVIPLIYVVMGGMQSSIVSDSVQAVFACFFLVIVLSVLESNKRGNDDLMDYLQDNARSNFFRYNPVHDESRSMLSLRGGVDMMVLGLIQGTLSYPFFDPVLTDRCFLSHPTTMARAFTLGGLCAAWFIVLFAIIGVYGNMLGQCVTAGVCSESDLKGADVAAVTSGSPPAVATTLGDSMFNFICLIMITSSMSTLDSTFTSIAKIIGPDLHGYLTDGKPLPLNEATAEHIKLGRIMMVVIAIGGTCLLETNPNELNATTMSGTMVMGIGAPIIGIALMPKAWRWTGQRPLAFLVPFYVCVALGVCFQLTSAKDKAGEYAYPEMRKTLDFSAISIDGCGSYGVYLGINILGHVLAFVLWFVFAQEWCWFTDGAYEALEQGEEPEPEDLKGGASTKSVELTEPDVVEPELVKVAEA